MAPDDGLAVVLALDVDDRCVVVVRTVVDDERVVVLVVVDLMNTHKTTGNPFSHALPRRRDHRWRVRR